MSDTKVPVSKKAIRRILIANRGEIALRVMRTCKRMGIHTIAVYSEIDRTSPHALYADESFFIGPAPSTESYLNIDNILSTARAAEADAIHPGYGFLSENPIFVERVIGAGMTFIGPGSKPMRLLGHKDQAREIAIRAGVPVVPGYQGADQSPETLAREADRIGFPVMIKAAAGGGGKGMRKVMRAEDFVDAVAAAQRESLSFFGDQRIILEQVIYPARHIEVQIVADKHGKVIHLFERDCSLQRRHQKIIEESPAPGLAEALRKQICDAAVTMAKASELESATTMEFLVPMTGGSEFYFLEANCRIQVEHPVTEMLTDIDIVELQIRIAEGEQLPIEQKNISLNGHAIEARLYAEVASQGFMPRTGTISHCSSTFDSATSEQRIDHAVSVGLAITSFYDPLLAKIIVRGTNRSEALNKLLEKLLSLSLLGVDHNGPFLARLLEQPEVKKGTVGTSFVEERLTDLCSNLAGMDQLTSTLISYVALETIGIFNPMTGAAIRHETDPFKTCNSWRITSAKSSGGYQLFLPWCDYIVRCTNGGTEHTFRARARSVTPLPSNKYSVAIEVNGNQVHIAIIPSTEAATCKFPLEVEIDSVRHSTLWATSTNELIGDHIAMSTGLYNFTVQNRSMIRASSAHEDESDGRIVAPLPGTLISLKIAEGSSVQRGDALASIESMKMEHIVSAPNHGVVEKILVHAGDLVKEGQELLTIR